MRRLRFVTPVVAGAIALACAAGLHAQVAPPAAAPAPAAIPPLLAKPAVKPVAKPSSKLGDKPLWSQLTPAQKTALDPLHGEWDPLEGVRKQKWLEFTKSYATMKPDEQQRVHERMREWIRLTPEQRKLARSNYIQSKTIAPNEKSATWESYKQLPDAQKHKLAEQATRKPLTNLPSKAAQHATAPVLRNAPSALAPANAATAAPVK